MVETIPRNLPQQPLLPVLLPLLEKPCGLLAVGLAGSPHPASHLHTLRGAGAPGVKGNFLVLYMFNPLWMLDHIMTPK